MPNDSSYTTEEIAKLLKISKLTVYDLIKKGKLPAYRVGKQMRVDAADLEAYQQQSKGGRQAVAPVAMDRAAPASPAHPNGIRPLVITGQDISLDLLAKHIENSVKGVRPLRSYVGSLDSLISMYRGESDIVSTLPGLRLVNREIGSGARVLLDEQLRLHHISAGGLIGYDRVETSHMGVAGTVAVGEADVGIGIEKAASIVGHVEFIPLIQERYDLVMLKTPHNLDWMESITNVLQSEAFQKELRSIQGYDLTLTGRILLET